MSKLLRSGDKPRKCLEEESSKREKRESKPSSRNAFSNDERLHVDVVAWCLSWGFYCQKEKIWTQKNLLKKHLIGQVAYNFIGSVLCHHGREHGCRERINRRNLGGKKEEQEKGKRKEGYSHTANYGASLKVRLQM